MKFEPHPYQHDMIGHVLENPRSALFAPMGSGKTVSMMTALSHLDLVRDGPALVLAPLRVAKNTWPKEGAKWDHLGAFPVEPITGTADERAAALKRDAAVYTINYENLPWLREHLGKKRWPFSLVVADESTKLKNFRLRGGGRRARALGQIAFSHVDRWVNLTGTPSPNGLEDLWGQTWFLDQGQRLGRTVEAFTQRWFRPKRGGFGIEPWDFAEAQIHERIRDLCLTPDLGFSVDEPTTFTVEVDLPSAARRIYRDMEKRMFAELRDGAIVEAVNAAAKTIKCLQIASGGVYLEAEGPWRELHDAKIDALESVIAESGGEPVMVAYHWRPTLERLRRAFPKGRVLDAKRETEDAWNRGEIPLLFAHPQSAGHGLNLQDGGRTLAFVDHWWKLEDHDQIIERIGPLRQKQAGHPRDVRVYYIEAVDTLDEVVRERRTSKRKVQDLLMEAMKRAGY